MKTYDETFIINIRIVSNAAFKSTVSDLPSVAPRYQRTQRATHKSFNILHAHRTQYTHVIDSLSSQLCRTRQSNSTHSLTYFFTATAIFESAVP